MRAAEEYREYARQCRQLAATMTRPEEKKILEEIADAWERAAALREHDLVKTNE
jgi:Skp family chaperone for outer membrane proteins